MSGPTIKLMAYNELRQQWEEVFPEDEFQVERAIPLFLGQDGKFYTVPGTTVAQVWDEWLHQVAHAN